MRTSPQTAQRHPALDAWGAYDRDDPYRVFAQVRAAGPAHPVRLADGHSAWLIVGKRTKAKPRVAQSQRGRELRAAAALARFGDNAKAKKAEEPEAPNAGSVERVTQQPVGKATGDSWELGKPAPRTMYLDYDNGEVTETQPVRAVVIVNEGHVVTPDILRQIKGA